METTSLFSRPEIIWFAIGLVLIIAELGIPGLIIIFFGIGAWVTALVCLVAPLGLNAQLLVFLIASVLSLIVLRRSLNKLFHRKESLEAETLSDEFIGKIGEAQTDLHPERPGKVAFKGTVWEALTTAPVKKGERVRITGKDSITLKVEPTDKNNNESSRK